MLVVDFTTIKLLTAPLNYVAIDGSHATGAAHTLRLPIAPGIAVTDAPLSAVDTIDLGYPHGFATGQRVFYSHGGGDSIGGLAHKNEYFVIRVSDTVIRLATIGDNATNGVWIDLDTSVAGGTSHAIGAPFRAVQVVDSTADTIYFDGVHTYRDGEAVVYDNGGGTNIGGLMHELTYYVTRIDSHTLQLSTDPADRSGSVVNLGGTVATGTGHTLLGPSGFGSVTSGGAITVQATNTGTIGTGTLAAAGTKTAKADASANAKETPAGTKWGIAVSGSVSVNIIDDTAEAFLRRAVVVKSDGLDVRATNDTDNTAISGAFALSFNKSSSTSVALAGAVTVNLFDNRTQTLIENSSLTDAGVVTVAADATGNTVAIAAGLGVSANGYGLAGSVAINTIDSDTQAYLTGGAIAAGSLSITALDTTSIIAVAGAIAYGGKAGIGAGFAYNTIDGGAQAWLSSAAVDVTGAVVVKAENNSQITAVAIAGAFAGAMGSTKSNAFAGAGSVTVNTVSSKVGSRLRRSRVTTTNAGKVGVAASDDSTIIADAGGVALAIAIGQGSEGSSLSRAVGAAVAFNRIEGSDVEAAYVEATVDDSFLSAAGAVEVTATSTTDIDALTLAGAGAVGGSGGGGGTALSGAGAYSENTIDNNIEARVRASDVTAGSVVVTASNGSMIDAETYGFSVAGVSLTASQENAKITAYTVGGAIARSKNVTLTVGATVASNTITADVQAYISNSTDVVTTASGSIKLEAKQQSTITAYSVAASIAVSTGDDGFALSGGGAKATNEIFGNANAYLLDSAVISGKDVILTATSTSTIDATVVGLAVAGSGGPAALGIGVSLATNTIGTVHDDGTTTPFEVRAYVRNSSIDASSGNLTQTATSASTITSTIVAASAAVTAKSKFGVGLGGAGADSTNHVATWVQAAIDGGSTAGIHATGISLIADDTSKITAITVGASLSATDHSSIHTVSVAASVAVALSKKAGFSASGAGAESTNRITTKTNALVQNSVLTASGHVTITSDAGSAAGSEALTPVGDFTAGLDDAATADLLEHDTTIGGIVYKAGSPDPTDFAGDNAFKTILRNQLALSPVDIELSTDPNDLAVTIRKVDTGADPIDPADDTGVEWSVTDRKSGTSVILAKDAFGNFTVFEPQISAVVIGASLAVAVGKEGGAGLAIGASVARNLIGSDQDESGGMTRSAIISTNYPGEVQARILNSSVTATDGNLVLTATAQQSIDAFVGAFAAAVAGGTKGGLAGAGAGARATNGISMNVTAAIDGDGASGIHAGSITIGAADTSSIEAVTGAAALAISFGKAGALSIAVGVALAENVIQNDVQAYLARANSVTTTGTGGAISVTASETASINSTTFAASAAIALGKVSFAAAVGVLEATNTLDNKVAAYITGSGSVGSAGAVTVSATDTGVISADTFSLAVAVGVVGVGVGIGSGENTITDDVSAYVHNSTITASAGDIAVTATSSPSITTTSTTVAVSASLGAAVAVFDATTTVGGTTEAYLQDAVLTATGHAVQVTSTSTETLSPLVRRGAGGLVAVGIMLSEATVEGSTLAHLAGQTTVTANSLTVTASDTSTATPVTNLGSVGAVGVSHAKTDAVLQRNTEASIAANARITLSSGSLIVQAQCASTAYTSSRSDGGGAIAVSNLDINSTVNSVTRATVASSAAIVVPATKYAWHTGGSAQGDQTGAYNATREIDWNGNVVVLSGPDPELVVDASGVIVKAIGVTVGGLGQRPARGRRAGFRGSDHQ